MPKSREINITQSSHEDDIQVKHNATGRKPAKKPNYALRRAVGGSAAILAAVSLGYSAKAGINVLSSEPVGNSGANTPALVGEGVLRNDEGVSFRHDVDANDTGTQQIAAEIASDPIAKQEGITPQQVEAHITYEADPDAIHQDPTDEILQQNEHVVGHIPEDELRP